MTENNPRHLKLHTEELAESRGTGAEPWGVVEQLPDAFREATGWAIRLEPARGVDGRWSDGGMSGSAPEHGFSFQLEEPKEGSAPVERSKAKRLAASFVEILNQLGMAREAIWHREAELAAGVPVTADTREEAHLAVRLEAVLKGGAQAIGCQAAAVYLLDEATTELKLRACWGLPKRRLLDPARALRGAVADLEALVGHAVVLEDASLLPHWRAPEPFASAICVPIATSNEPLGTLWVFCDQPRDFSQEQANLVEIIAGRIASELQRAMLLRECVQTKQVDRHLLRAVDWQNDRLPSVAPLLDDWEVAGWTSGEMALREGFYDWYVSPGGRLALVVGSAAGTMLEAALTSAALHGAIRAHSHYRHDAAQMVHRINETVWNSSAGGQYAALLYALIDPETGEVESCVAGEMDALVLRADGPRSLKRRCPALGMQPGEVYRARRFRLTPGDVLVITDGLWGGVQDSCDARRRRRALARVLRRCRRESPEDLIAAIRQWRDDTASGGELPSGTLLVARRKPAPAPPL